MNDLNIHSGHRERMIKKYMENPEAILEHELLEILLYPLLPRKDTNVLAHKLLRTFGNLKNIFSATPKELTSVEGVGNSIATHLSVIGKIINCSTQKSNSIKGKHWFTFERNRQDIINLFSDCENEKCYVLLLDKNYDVLSELGYTNEDETCVTANMPEIANVISILHPTFAILCHNHLSGSILPSEEDDFATYKLNWLCDIHRVKLIDHIIVSKDDAFSYHTSHRIEKIRSNTNFKFLIKNNEKED